MATTRRQTIGMIGVGAMGSRVCNNLIRAGFPVRVFDVSPERSAPFRDRAQAICASPQAAAAGSDLVLVAVRADDQLEAACFGPEGAVEVVAPGCVLACLSTVSVGAWQSVVRRWMERGGHCLDAAMAGSANENSIDAAEKGTLTILIGGDPEVLQEHMPVFKAIGARILHMGPHGAGLQAKLISNFLLVVNVVATCEMLALAARIPLSEASILDMVQTSAGSSWVTSHWQRLKEVAGLLEHYERGGSADLLLKDAKAGLALFDDYDVTAVLHRAAATTLAAQLAIWGQKG